MTVEFNVKMVLVAGEILSSDVAHIIRTYTRGECPDVVIDNLEVEEVC